MYVVTGATGRTGQVVTKRLLANGQKVRAIGRSSDRLRPLVAEGAEPFVGDLTDQQALTKAFSGARGVYAMIPPTAPTTEPYRSYQNQISDAIAGALAAAGVQHAVTLSSFGADKPDKTGPVVGLHNLEQKLNKISGLNVLHLRAGYFMENTLTQVEIIHAMGIAGGPLRPDLKLAMIATRDIGAAAAEELLKLEFQNKQTRELQGQRDLTMTEAATIIGKAIGKPDLAYKQLPDEQVRTAMVQFGMSPDLANLILEMAASLNSGYMRTLEPRSQRNTTPTPFEVFVAEEFVPAFQAKARAA
ncbi:MAG: Epimerase [Acidobacteriaceae bacterium]|nr:Epimerase [Acidobacteriaceae bacterium]